MSGCKQELDGRYSKGEGDDRIEYLYRANVLVGVAGKNWVGGRYFAIWLDEEGLHKEDRDTLNDACQLMEEKAAGSLSGTAMFSAETDRMLRVANCGCGGECNCADVA